MGTFISVWAKDLLNWVFWRYVRNVVVKVPFKLITIISTPIAMVQIIFCGTRRSLTLSELSLCRLAEDRKLFYVLYKAFRRQLNYMIKLCYLPKINNENAYKYFQVDGSKHLDEALSRGKGAILLNPHFGPFMFAISALVYRGYKLNQVAIQGHPPTGERTSLGKTVYELKLEAIERNMPVNFINAANSMATRNVLRVLDKNEVVLFSSTGRAGRSWRVMNFLDRNASFNLAPFKIAVKKGITLLPVFVTEEGYFARVTIERPIEMLKGDAPEDILEKYVLVLESYVKKNPEYFAYFLYEVRVKARWDDHPFFSDYPLCKRSKR